MRTVTKNQAAQKLVKIVALPEFTEDIALGYVEVILDIEYNNERDDLDEYDIDYLVDAAGQDGWLD